MSPGAIDGSISVVISTYNVAPYIDDFLDSLDAQTHPLAELDLVFVDDGSTDGSGERVRKWSAANGVAVQVVTQPNGGLSNARNAGLLRVTHEWVTFCDPDDVLAPDYFATVSEFLRSTKASTVDLVTCNVLILNDATGDVTDDHPLRFKFAEGARTVDLERQPTHIHLSAASAFYRRSLIDEHQLRFDHRVRPNFEDAHFTARYLAHRARPRVRQLPSARYQYRRRTDRTSLVQSSWSRNEKYTNVTRYGHLALLTELRQRLGRIPRWAQNLILYDLGYYFREDEKAHSATGALPPEVTAEFHEVVTEIVSMLEIDVIDSYSITSLPYHMRRALIVGYKGEEQRPTEVAVVDIDGPKQIAKLRYFFGGALPVEEYRSGGLVVRPIHSKIRRVTFFGRDLVYERIVWLSATGTIAVSIDGRSVPLHVGAQRPPDFLVSPTKLWRTIRGVAPPGKASTFKRDAGTTASVRVRDAVGRARTSVGQVVRQPSARHNHIEHLSDRLARAPIVRRHYADAWLLMDRDVRANDNAEHLYRHLSRRRPEIKIWFVLRPDSPDWARLSEEGFRLLPHGSRRHAAAVMHARHVISSHVDRHVLQPFARTRVGRPSHRVTFLQHCVTNDDLSHSLNSRPISLFVTVTDDEHDSIVGDLTPYTFTTKEVKLTGFPRHDHLLALARSTSMADRLLLIMPAWRRDLLGTTVAGDNTRRRRGELLSSSFAANWIGLMTSPELRAAAHEGDARIAFMPHPDTEEYLDVIDLPDHVEVLRPDGSDFQAVLARSALLVTDCSPHAFDMAYIERPVVYLQFDQQHNSSGGPGARKGTWTYETHGFGPVVSSTDGALSAIGEIARTEWRPSPLYAERMRTTFPLRDGRACERVVTAILDLDRPLTFEEAYLRVED